MLFVAPAEEIDTWGGVPQKSSRFMKGFQRADSEAHSKDVAEFFETPGNISPTAIVVAFKPGSARVKPLENSAFPSEQFALLEVDYEDPTDVTISSLAARIADELQQYEESDDPSADSRETDAEVEEEEGELDDEEDEALPGEPGELQISGSHLSQFLHFLRDADALHKVEQEDPAKLRKMLHNLVKPATIVDGQHRTKGAASVEMHIKFPVVGLLNADWKEQVFQFVVINQRAKPIPAEFLSAIISSSLSSGDISKMTERLEQAGVRLDNARIMELVNGDAKSPFQGMVDFKIQGSGGRLPYAGMLTLARRFRGLRTHVGKLRFPQFFKQIFRDGMPGERYSEKRAEWQNRAWFEYFSEFWTAVKEHVADEKGGYDRLWSYGSNLLKIVTLQELQNLFLQWVFDRMEVVSSVTMFTQLAKHYLRNLKPIFFEKDWKLPSLQSGTGRQYLRNALEEAIKNPRFDYDEPLFTGVGGTGGGRRK